MDITAINSLHRLYDECKSKGIQMVFSHVNEQPMSVFQKSGMYELDWGRKISGRIFDAGFGAGCGDGA